MDNINDEPLRVLALLTGDVTGGRGDAAAKYGELFRALAAHCDLVGVYDVELRGLDRYQNALRTVRWPSERWRQAFYKNPWAFHRRSRRAQAIVGQYRDRVDVVVQHGALFLADDGPASPPTVLYADFTYRLAQREDRWRNPFADPEEGERWNGLEAVAIRRASFVLTRSAYTLRSMVTDYGVPPERVAVVGGGMNFSALPAPGTPPASPRVLFVGRDFERKGGEQLLAAFARVRERLPEAELWLVTARADVGGPGVRRLAPTYDRESLAALYRSASVFAMPSRCETWGDVFLEAMAYGLPCIGTTNNAMPEIIRHGESGYLVEEGDIDELAARLEQLLHDPALRQRMGACGRERVESTFTWEQVVRRMLPYLEQVRAERAALIGA